MLMRIIAAITVRNPIIFFVVTLYLKTITSSKKVHPTIRPLESG